MITMRHPTSIENSVLPSHTDCYDRLCCLFVMIITCSTYNVNCYYAISHLSSLDFYGLDYLHQKFRDCG